MSEQSRRRGAVLGAGAVALLLAVVLAGCAAPARTAARPRVSPSAAAEARSGASAEPAPQLVESIPLQSSAGLIKDDTKWSVGPHSVIYAQGDSRQPAENAFAFTMVSLPADGAAVHQDGTILPPSTTDELREEAVGAEADPEAEPGFVVAYDVVTAQNGLKASETHLVVSGYSAASADPTDTVTLTACPFADCSVDVVRRVGDTAVVGVVSTEAKGVLGISLSKQRVVWSSAGSALETVNGRVAVLSAAGETGPVTGIDAATGKPVWTLPLGAGTRYSDGFSELGASYGLVGYHPAGYDRPDTALVLDLRTGKTVATLHGYLSSGLSVCPDRIRVSYDAVKDQLVSTAYDRPGDDGRYQLAVTDRATGTAVLTVPPDQRAKLDCIETLGATDGRVWVSTSSGPDIIDVPSGEQDPESPAHGVPSTDAPAATPGTGGSKALANPIWTVGDVTVMGTDTTPTSILVHQNQPLSFALALANG